MAEDLTKRFYVQNVSGWKNIGSNNFLNKELEVKVIERGIVLPTRKVPNGSSYEGGVCDKDFNFVAGFIRKSPNGKDPWLKAFCCESSYVVDRKEVIQLDEDVIFGGIIMGHLGHFLTDYLCRLWYVVQNPELKSKVLFVLIDGNYKSWLDEFFILMGIDKERIVYVKEPIQCRSVIVPEQSSYNTWNYFDFTKEFLIPCQAIKSRVTPGKIKKLYLTRSDFDGKNTLPWRRCFNEKYFEDFFSARGFEIIAPEKLSIEEQISLIMGADEIAAVLGTLTHWAIFCKPNAKFIMLNRTNSVQDIQIVFNSIFKFENYYIIDVAKNFMYARHDNGVFLLGSNEYWKAFVADYFGEQIGEDDDKPYLEESLDKYIEHWCNRYSDKKNFDIWVRSFKDLCNRIIMLEEQLNENRPLLSYQTHVASKGWGTWKNENVLSNQINEQFQIEAIKIDFPTHKVYYAVYFNDKEGWSAEVTAPEMAGTTGKFKAITGIKIRLDESGAKDFDILYRVHKFDGSWSDWAKNGEAILSHGQKLNAIQITLKPKSDSPPSEK